LAVCLKTHLGILGLHNKILLVMSYCLIIVISLQNFSKLGVLHKEVILNQKHCITSTKRAILLYCTGYTITPITPVNFSVAYILPREKKNLFTADFSSVCLDLKFSENDKFSDTIKSLC